MGAFDWGGYLTLATTLARETDEASRRTAVSRAYYYVYHLARARADSNGFTPTRGGIHTQTWGFYQNSPDAQCKELALLGGRMQTRREKADYEPLYPRLDEEVADMLGNARAFAEKLARIDVRHPNRASQRGG